MVKREIIKVKPPGQCKINMNEYSFVDGNPTGLFSLILILFLLKNKNLYIN